MEQVLSEAQAKGLFMVNENSIEELKSEFQDVFSQAIDLCEIVDSESTPYKSKYEARTMLDNVVRKMEAAKTIASLEKNKENMKGMAQRIACAQVKIGTISYECEEPHNAQSELESAAEYYFPGYVLSINEICPDSATKPEFDGTWFPPSLELADVDCVLDAMKCLNMIGILWSGRGQIKKSYFYLLSAKMLYHDVRLRGISKSTLNFYSLKSIDEELESNYTHNLFYLAQAYGNIGEAEMSCRYCHETLRRQLEEGFLNHRAAVQWAKNCSNISDFYLSMGYFYRCYLSLSAAEFKIKEIISNIQETASSESNLLSEVAEIEADIYRRFARLDVVILKNACDREHCRLSALEREVEVDLEPFESDYIKELQYLDYDPYMEAKNYEEVLKKQGKEFVASTVFNFPSSVPAIPSSSNLSYGEMLQQTLFPHLGISVPSLLQVQEIDTFDKARMIFLRATTRIEACKKYYVLDGFVTDHVQLLQDQSKLFHYLAAFETDTKRKLAMESRRVEMLKPVLKSLNRTAYEGLHKQISYELGESFLVLLDIKLEKYRNRSNGGEIDIKSLKKAEIEKCNSYCHGVLEMMTHFINLYARNQPANPTNTVFDTSLPQLLSMVSLTPDFSLISEEEVRPYLNSHFLSCRALTKIIVPPQADREERSRYLVACQSRYEWLAKFARELCQKKNIAVDDVFGEELKICEDMKKLLPSKIDRVHYYGESGLSL